ncbi:MAG: agmatine deiminase family protein [Cyclobacteriaceae bacterium]|nr:agmatine deiminase family protein [Cyclobacteriaceae bacterium]
MNPKSLNYEKATILFLLTLINFSCKQAFPGRKIVFIDAMPLNWQDGGIHCSTQQEPKRKDG